MRRNIIAAASAGFAAGSVVGYYLGRYFTNTAWMSMVEEMQSEIEQSTEEIEGLSEFLEKIENEHGANMVEDVEDVPDPPEVEGQRVFPKNIPLDDLKPGKIDYTAYSKGFSEPEEEEPVEVKLEELIVPDAVEIGQGWDMETERKRRSGRAPFIIHVSEYGSNESFREHELIYYEGDGVFCDNDGNAMMQAMQVIGEDNLRWGHGSEDSNMVYVRNVQQRCDYMITRDSGTYAEVHLGLGPDGG